jgi:hypothetical protein
VNISSRIAAASAFFVAAALFYAPLAYGCTRPEMLPALFGLLTASIVAGVIGFAAMQRWPDIPRLLLVCVTAILLQGWWMTWNPVFPSTASANEGLVDTTLENIRRLSSNFMTSTSFLLGAFIVLCGLFGNANLRRFLLLAAAISGVLICVIGDVLKIAGEPLMRYFWKPIDIYWNDFALFRYHGNAGAFLNLVWPLILVFTRRAYRPTGTLVERILWTFSALACGSALFLNAAKAAMVIGLLILPWPFYTLLVRLKQRTLLFLAVGTVIFIAGALAVLSQYTHEASFQRITNRTELSSDFSGRWESNRENLEAVPEVGWFGLGPGLFQLAFPYQLSPMRNVGDFAQDYAHEDYLQTVLEWGWLGTVWWTLLVAVGLYRAIRTYAQREMFPSKTDRHLLLAAILGVCATLAQSFVEFPLQVVSLRLFFFVLLAFCWISPQLLTTPPKDPSSRRKRYRLPIPSPELMKANR